LKTKTKTVNRFLDLNFLLLHVHLSESITVGHWSLLITRLYCRKFSNFSIRFLKSDRPNSGLTGWNLSSTVKIRLVHLDFDQIGQNLTSVAGIWLLCLIPANKIQAKLARIWPIQLDSILAGGWSVGIR
jgi:hypothetical protein